MKVQVLPTLLKILVLFEIFCHGILGFFISQELISVTYLFVGIAIPMLALAYFISFDQKDDRIDQKLDWTSIILIFALLILSFLYYGKLRLGEVPIDYKMADMLPIIRIMAARFLEGTDVYRLIPEIWDGTQPIYLPGFWLPFVISEIYQFDMRWISIFFFLCAVVIIIGTCLGRNKKLTNQIPILFIVFILICSVLTIDSSLITLTQEPISIFYYVLLCAGITAKNPIVTGIAGALCCLSRFIFLPWWIIFILFSTAFLSKKFVFRLATTSIVTFLAIVLFTNSWGQLHLYFDLPGHYLDSIIDNPGKYQSTIAESLGISKFFDLEVYPSLNALMTVCSIFIPLAGFTGYVLLKDKIDYAIFALIMLKLSLVFTLNLLLIPYSYLFYTSTFISLMILSVIPASTNNRMQLILQ